MFIALVFVLLVVAIVTKVINYKPLTYISILIVTPFLMFNRGNNDYLVYAEMFYHPENSPEPGYSFLLQIIQLCGGTSHEQVLLILGIFFAFTLYRFTKYTKSMNLILFLYVLFPFILDLTQVRDTFMLLFMLNAILEYYNKSKLRCYVLLVIGCTFHYFGIFYIISFLMLDFFKKKNSYIIIALVSLANLVLMPFMLKLGISVIPIQSIASRLIIYSTGSMRISTLLVWGSILLVDLIVLKFFIRHLDSSERDKNKELIKILYDLMYSGIIFFGCVLYLFESTRFFRNLFIIKYLLVGFMLPNMNRDEKILIILYLVITSSLFAYAYSLGLDYDYALLSNALFN